MVAAGGVLAIAAVFVPIYEGTVLGTYVDPVGIPTACMGETGPHIRLGQRFTMAQCEAMLDASLLSHARGLDDCIHVPLAAHEAAAVLSFGYNVGVRAACTSTMVRMVNAGRPAAEWCPQLERWVYAKGIKLNGLVKRRAAERALCEGRLAVLQ
jgi:lysozyme